MCEVRPWFCVGKFLVYSGFYREKTWRIFTTEIWQPCPILKFLNPKSLLWVGRHSSKSACFRVGREGRKMAGPNIFTGRKLAAGLFKDYEGQSGAFKIALIETRTRFLQRRDKVAKKLRGSRSQHQFLQGILAIKKLKKGYFGEISEIEFLALHNLN